MITTGVKLDDGWCINRHTGSWDSSVEWYSLSHFDKDHDEVEVGYDDDNEDGSILVETCPECDTSVSDEIIGFLKLCLWDT